MNNAYPLDVPAPSLIFRRTWSVFRWHHGRPMRRVFRLQRAGRRFGLRCVECGEFDDCSYTATGDGYV